MGVADSVATGTPDALAVSCKAGSGSARGVGVPDGNNWEELDKFSCGISLSLKNNLLSISDMILPLSVGVNGSETSFGTDGAGASLKDQ